MKCFILSVFISILFIQAISSQQPPSTLYVVTGNPRYTIYFNTIDLQSGEQILNLPINVQGELYGFVNSNLPENITVIYPFLDEVRKGTIDVTTGTITASESSQLPDGLLNIGTIGYSLSKDTAYIVTDSFGPVCIRFAIMDFITGNSSIIDTDLLFDIGNSSSPDSFYYESKDTLYGVYVYQSLYHIITFNVNGQNYTDFKTNLPAKSQYYAEIFVYDGQVYLIIQESNQISIYGIDMESGKYQLVYSTKSNTVPDINYFLTTDGYLLLLTSNGSSFYIQTIHIASSFKLVSSIKSPINLISMEAIWAQ